MGGYNSRIWRKASSTAWRCAGETAPRRCRNRSLETARIWSGTATAGRPAHLDWNQEGGLGCGEVESGTTTTVLRCWLRTFVVSTRQGRVFLIFDPRTGSSWTHQTSPRLGPCMGPPSGLRRGVGPRLGDLAGDGVEILFQWHGPLDPGWQCSGGLASPPYLLSPASAGLGGAEARGFSEEQRRQVFRQCERHLSVCHRTILPYSRCVAEVCKCLSWLGVLDPPLRSGLGLHLSNTPDNAPAPKDGRARSSLSRAPAAPRSHTWR